MPEIILWGATGHAKVLHEALSDSGIEIVAVVDNRELESPIAGVPVLRGELGLTSWLMHRRSTSSLLFALAVGGSRGRDRVELLNLLKRTGLRPHTVVHRTAFCAVSARLGDACQLLAQSAVCADARLGSGVIVNTAASVDHDCIVGDGVHIAPGAHIAGEVIVGARAFVGTGAIVLPRLRIGEDAVVGAGAVVTRDVKPGSTVVGNPANQVSTEGIVEARNIS